MSVDCLMLHWMGARSEASQVLKQELLLTVTAISLAICGPTIPGMVPAVLVIPMSIPAYLGAISSWLMLYPPMPSALNPSPSVIKVTAVAVLVPK